MVYGGDDGGDRGGDSGCVDVDVTEGMRMVVPWQSTEFPLLSNSATSVSQRTPGTELGRSQVFVSRGQPNSLKTHKWQVVDYPNLSLTPGDPRSCV